MKKKHILITIIVLVAPFALLFNASNIAEFYKEHFFESKIKPRQIQISGEINGYPINIDEVIECKSVFKTETYFGAGGWLGTDWGAINPYSYQINKDGSIFAFLRYGFCRDYKSTSFHKPFVKAVRWAPSNKYPKEIQGISYEAHDNLSISAFDAQKGTKITIKPDLGYPITELFKRSNEATKGEK